MKRFENPEVSMTKFAFEDIITTSLGNGDNNTGDEEM